MPATWKMWSKEILGYVPTLMRHTERLVVVRKIQSWLDKGYSERQIFLMWNQGHAGKCSKGVNKHGAAYNSCAYAEAGLVALAN